MNNSEYPPAIAKVFRDELARFLSQHGENWELVGLPGIEQFVTSAPMAVDEVINVLRIYRPAIEDEDDYVYVYSDRKDPYEAANAVDWQAIPVIDANRLEDYIIRSVMGDDFLWIAPSREDLSNGQHLVILPGKVPVAVDGPAEWKPLVADGPRITGISIENFKGVRDRIDLELRPITLLFGANSAGKSTILHALHYAREIFERHNLNPDRTVAGGAYVDLGGFLNFVHQPRRDGSPVKIGFRVDLTSVMNESHWLDLETFSDVLQMSRWTFGTIDRVGDFQSAEVYISIKWSEWLQSPYVSELSVSFDDQEFAVIRSDSQGHRVTLQIETNHRSLDTLSTWAPGPGEDIADELEDFTDFFDDPGRTCLDELLTAFKHFCEMTNDGQFYLSSINDVLPPFKQLPLILRERDEWPTAMLPEGVSEWQFVSDMKEGIGMLISMPMEIIREFLIGLRYLGPLRVTPARNYTPPKYPDDSRWASGLGAWDTLHDGDNEFVESVSDWLGSEDKLNSGYRIERRTFKEIDLADPAFRQLLTGRAFDEADENTRLKLERYPTRSRLAVVPTDSDIELRPHDVGIGISQVVPVLVTALQGDRQLLAIEQPELHLHPKLQAELGDLFIEAALRDPKHIVILETHSELIPLRLMRRIRESITSDAKNAIRPRIRSKDVAIYYIESYQGATITTLLELSKEGQLLDPWPDGFFEEGFHERFAD